MTYKHEVFGPGREVDLKVYIYRRPHMRDESLEYELHMGTNVLRSIFDKMEMLPDVKEVFLSFPENWLNIIEQRVLFQRLGHYCPNLEKVTIKTQSVYIIQCTPNGSCLIINGDNDGCQETDKDGNTDLTSKLYSTMVGNVINSQRLTVLK